MGDKFCEVCTVNVAMTKENREFRNVDNAPEEKEFIVCAKCSRLNNFWFLRIWRAKDKEAAICELLEGSWERWANHDKDEPGACDDSQG